MSHDTLRQHAEALLNGTETASIDPCDVLRALDQVERELLRVVREANGRICDVLTATGRTVAEFPLVASPLLADGEIAARHPDLRPLCVREDPRITCLRH